MLFVIGTRTVLLFVGDGTIIIKNLPDSYRIANIWPDTRYISNSDIMAKRKKSGKLPLRLLATMGFESVFQH